MYISDLKKADSIKKSVSIDRFLAPKNELVKKIEAPLQEKLITEHSADVLAHWQAPEFEIYEQNKKWLLYITFLFIAIIAYALYSNSPIMAITFVLFGVVGYIHIGKEPRILNFMITNDGVVAGNEIFEYERIKSFWIFYEANDIKIISLHINSYLTPYIHIPIHNEDPVKIREVLLNHTREIKQKRSIVDALERFLGI